MAKTKPEAPSMFEPIGQSLLSDEDHAKTDQLVGPSARDAIKIAPHPQRMVKLVDIIEDSPVQFRANPFDQVNDDIDRGIFETMSDPAVGLINPITIQEIEGTGTGLLGVGKKYRMVAGHRRRASALLLGWEYIQAVIWKSDEDPTPITLSENSGVQSLTQYERAMQLKKAEDLYPGISHADLAKKASMESSLVYRLLQALTCPDALLDLFIQGMSLKTVLVLRPVFEAAEESKRKNLSERLVDCTLAKAESLASSVKKGIDPFEAIEMLSIRSRRNNIVESVVEPSVPVESIVEPSISVESVVEPSVSAVVSDSVETTIESPVREKATESVKVVKPVQSAKSAPSLGSGVRDEPEYTIPQAGETGTRSEYVGKLISEAKAHNLSLIELDQMCVISGAIDDYALAYDHLVRLQADPRTYRLLEKYCDIAKTVVRLLPKIENSGNAELVDSIRAVIFNPLPVGKAKKGKKK